MNGEHGLVRVGGGLMQSKCIIRADTRLPLTTMGGCDAAVVSVF